MINSHIFSIFAKSDMKQKGYVCDYIEERDADLLRAYKEIISVRDNIRLSEVVALLAKSPSKRFWVSESQAYKVILRILGGGSLSHMIPTRRTMYQEIFRRYQAYRVLFPSLTKMEIVNRVCNEPSPSFYLTPKSIVTILSRVRKEEKRRCLERAKKRLRFMLGTL